MPNRLRTRTPRAKRLRKNMADETELTITRKRRGRYREYMRHSNPYKFPAARRRKGNFQKAKQSPAVTRNGFNKCESDVQEVFCEQPRELRCTVDTVELLQVEKTYTSPGEVCSYEQIQDMDDSSDSELEDKDDLLSDWCIKERHTWCTI